MRRALLALLVVLAAGGCQLRSQVGITVEEDGSGTVHVGVGLDDEALRKAGEVQLDDLKEAGWTITGPEEEADGLHWFRGTKPFGTPEEASAIVAEVAGEDGPFKDFSIRRSSAFARTTFHFTGTVDLSGGVEAFGDQDLAAALDGEPLGQDVADIEKDLGSSIDKVVKMQVSVQLPGKVSSNAPGKASNGATWNPGIGDGPIELTASSTSLDTAVIGWTAAAIASAIALVVLVVVRIVRRRRRTSEA